MLYSEKESERCPSCETFGFIIGTSHSQDVYQCPQCKLCFLKKEIRKNSANDNKWYEELRECTQSDINVFFRAMGDPYTKQLVILERLTSGRSILDVGCGLGIFLAVAKRRGWHVYGTEESPHAVYFAQKNFAIKYSANLETFNPDSMDVIRISHVLEHIPEPREFVTQLHKILRKNGILVIVVPNREPLIDTVVNRLRRIVSKKPKLMGAIYPDMHVLGFSTASLEKLISRFGFETIKLFTIGMGNSTYYPMFYDGLLKISPFPRSLSTWFRYWLPIMFDNLGNSFDKGEWIVGYFKKSTPS